MILQLPPYPKHRESGVAWLGKIPTDWGIERGKWLFNKISRPVLPASEIVTCFRNGTVTLRKNRREGGFSESLKEIGYQGVKKGDLVIHGMDAFAGAVGVSDSNGKCSPVYAVCRPVTNVNTDYYAYVVREMARSQWVIALTRGIRERSTDFRFETFSNQLLPVPEANTQKQIVAFLKHMSFNIEHIVRSKRRLIELLNEQKQAIIHQAVTRGLDPNVRMKPSGIDWLAEMPEKWVSVRLRNLALSLKTGPFGSQLHSSDYVTNGTPLINPVHMKDGKIIADPHCAIGPAKAKELAEHRLDSGDIVFARRGELGRCVRVSEVESGWFCGTGSIRLRLKEKSPQSEYLVMLLRSKGIAQWLSAQSVGATMENLSTAILSKLPLPLPPTTEQKAIQDFVNKHEKTIDRAIESVCRQIELLREYRTRLIADVVTGKLDVRGVRLDEAVIEKDLLEDCEENEAEMDSDKEIDAIEGLDE